jgi:hypothetical protein
MAVNSREELKQYALRALGAPVLEINIDADQLEDRIDEAIEYWRLYHHEGIEQVYMKHQVTASTLTLTSPTARSFTVGNRVTGVDSGATAQITVQTNTRMDDSVLYVRRSAGEFIVGEQVTDGKVTSTIADGGVFIGDVDKRYIEIPDLVYGVSRVIPFYGTQTSKSMFDLQYQLRLNDLYDLTSTSIIYYKQVMGHLALLDLELNGKPMFRFNRLQNRLHLDINWDADVIPGDYVVVECYRAMDPSVFRRVWNEPWLKLYTTALFKKNWAVNLKKFSGIQLPGGVTLDGQSMYNEAVQEIKELEDELIQKSAPLNFFVG